jgi:hypothetical protein
MELWERILQTVVCSNLELSKLISQEIFAELETFPNLESQCSCIQASAIDDKKQGRRCATLVNSSDF